MNLQDVPLTNLLALAAQGERAALDRVFEVLYPDLRRIAHARLREQGGVAHLNTTALVHESFLRLIGVSELALADRRHFFTYAAKTMRHIIIDFAREHLSQRRGGGVVLLELVAIHDALLELEAVDPGLAQIVEMRFFAGYSEAEIAELLAITDRTVRRKWEKARMFLLASLQA
jgi:RNA polymerase sigma factor (TIGR02999 family)